MTSIDDAENDFDLWKELLARNEVGPGSSLLAWAAAFPTDEAIAAQLRDLWRDWSWWSRVARDSPAAFATREWWTRPVSDHRARDSTEQWARKNLVLANSRQLIHRSLWPLPIGWDALRREWEVWCKGEDAIPFELAIQLPFGGDEYAAVIIEVEVSRARVEMFGLAMRHDDSELGPYYTVGPARFRIHADGPVPASVAKLTKNMASWWHVIGTGLFPRGRPPGSTYRTLDDYRKAFRNVEQELGRAPKSKAEFAELSGIPEDTLKDNFKSWGVRWSDFKREMTE